MAERYSYRPPLNTQQVTSASRAFSSGRKLPVAQAVTASPTIPSAGSPAVINSDRALTTGKVEDAVAQERTVCSICSEERGHFPTGCNAFMTMSPSERLKVILDLGNCFRCLGRNHPAKDCKKTDIFCTAIGCGLVIIVCYMVRSTEVSRIRVLEVKDKD